MPVGRYACGVQWHIVLGGVSDPPEKEGIWGDYTGDLHTKKQTRLYDELLIVQGYYCVNEWHTRKNISDWENRCRIDTTCRTRPTLIKSIVVGRRLSKPTLDYLLNRLLGESAHTKHAQVRNYTRMLQTCDSLRAHKVKRHILSPSLVERTQLRYDTIRYIICTEKLTGKLPV